MMDSDWINSEDLPQKDDIFFEKIDEDLDLAFALSLQEAFNEDATREVLTKEALTQVGATAKHSNSSNTIGIVDAQWELIDPHPDIHALFMEFNDKFFYGRLHGVEVKWSPRMTLCAGVCSYEGRGGLCSVRLSSPLLKLRPRRDLVETLLHEMIHAYLFVTANNKDHDAHGQEFLSHMYRINKETGTKITVYHSFHDEVDFFRKHWWKCNGPCAKRSPFYGVVKRAMNRAPGPKDRWWGRHQETCGGIFQKIKEPQDYKQKGSKRKNPNESTASKNATGIKNFFPSVPSTSKVPDSYNPQKKKKGEDNIQTIKSIFEKENNLVPVNSLASALTSVPGNSSLNRLDTFSGKGFTLGTASSSQQPTSLLSKIRRDIGYPNSRVVKPPASKQSSIGFISNTSVQSSQKVKPNISLPSSQKVKPNISAPSSQNVKPNISVQSSWTSKPNISLQSSELVGPNNKKLLGTGVSSNKKGSASFLMDSPTSATNTSKRKLLQSSIDSFVTSPVGTSEKGSVQANAIKKEENEIASNLVICPVCFIDVPSEIINHHLDCCLNKCS